MSFFANLRSPCNQIVFFDLATDSQELGRLEFELFFDTSPKIAELFRQLCVGEFFDNHNRPLGYKYSEVSKVFNEQYFIIETPDCFELGNYGPAREEILEYCNELHEPGSLGLMMESSKTEFYVTLGECEWLNGVLPCFGRVWKGSSGKVLEILKNALTLPGGRPKVDIKVVQCGQY